MIVRLIVQTVIWLAVMGAVLFASAGRLDWPGAWVFLLEMAVLGIGTGLWLGWRDPALLAERMASPIQKGQKTWDKAFMAALIVLWMLWLALMALDASRYKWSAVPAWLQAMGAVCLALCIYISALTFRENSYAAPVVKIQKERGHKVISTGPYRYVRHPMYAGALLFFIGLPPLLGSWWGLAVAPLFIILIGIRAIMEERMLAAELEGYSDYAARVRYRLIPHFW
jgi:protein-S-isoprenylcysteine O-methyltransferase Ste14